MRYNIILKSIAILLAACGITVALGSGLGIAVLANTDLYGQDYESWLEQCYSNRAEGIAVALAESYAARNVGNLSSQELQVIGWGNSWETIGRWHGLENGNWCYAIKTNGLIQETNYTRKFDGIEGYSFDIAPFYPKSVSVDDNWTANYDYYTQEGQKADLYIRYVAAPTYYVTIWLERGTLTEYQGMSLETMKLLASVRYELLICLACSLLLTGGCLVYLCCAAGRKSGEEGVTLRGLNRLPMDIYALVTAGVWCIVLYLTMILVDEFFYCQQGVNWGWMALGIPLVLIAAFSLVGFVFALVAQWKLGLRSMCRRSLLGGILRYVWKGITTASKVLCKLFGLLPLIWQYILIAFAMAAAPLLSMLLVLGTHGFTRGFWVLVLMGNLLTDLLIVIYGAIAYGTLLKGTQNMASGALDSKVDTRFLLGSYNRVARNLNTMADVAQEAAKSQMRAERMKTELITNVSHDIKTPLTSIINYVDLLQKAKTPEDTQQYLEVLERQSQHLKKLVEDLIEMSKASTGDVSVELVGMDAVEATNQALGEFADKLADRQLQVVFRQPETAAPVIADGRLVWRVLNNLLSNVVKYAMPGSRVYVDIESQENNLLLSIKNMSQEPLNISAQELTERFVRGDKSRNTEGSGLGLNIAKSLMEVQKGKLDLFVDGDLFKAVLTFCKER